MTNYPLAGDVEAILDLGLHFDGLTCPPVTQPAPGIYIVEAGTITRPRIEALAPEAARLLGFHLGALRTRGARVELVLAAEEV